MGTARIIGGTFGITLFSFIILALFIKSASILAEDFFTQNALIIFFITLILLVILSLTGAISLFAIMRKGKGLGGDLIG